jgi:hypothetical protein
MCRRRAQGHERARRATAAGRSIGCSSPGGTPGPYTIGVDRTNLVRSATPRQQPRCVAAVRRYRMYQICTNTAVSNGHLRTITDSRKVILNRQDAGLPGRPDLATIILITRRSQVQILPPPPTAVKESPGAAFRKVQFSRPPGRLNCFRADLSFGPPDDGAPTTCTTQLHFGLLTRRSRRRPSRQERSTAHAVPYPRLRMSCIVGRPATRAG